MTKKIRFLLALWVLKIAKVLLKVIRRQLPYYPGYLALRICPDFSIIANKPKLVIAITGTNGKTTLTSLVCDALNNLGINAQQNHGYNLASGIAKTLGDSLSIWGKQKLAALVFEIDEKTSPKLLAAIQPNYLLITNLFRDSMKNNGHISYIKNIIEKAITSDMILLLNADDIVSATLGLSHSTKYFSIVKREDDYKKPFNLINDMVYCPNCDSKLNYQYLRYFHVGKVNCPNCNFGNFPIDYLASFNKEENSLVVNKDIYPLDTNSIFNAYNVLQTISLLRELAYSPEDINGALSNIRLDEKRFTKDTVGEYQLIFHMAKGQNAIACSIVFDYVAHQKGNKIVLLMIEDVLDNRDSSETIAWLYDTDFEFLRQGDIKQIIVGGKRCLDIKVRLLLAGVPANTISCISKEIQMPDLIDFNKAKNVYLLFELFALDLANNIKQDILKRMAKQNGN